MKTENLFGEMEEIKQEGVMPNRNKSGGYITNPLLLLHGKMEGEKCKNCIHLIRKRFANTYYKCELRNNVDKCSPKSDHRVNWDACGKFEKGTEEDQTTIK